MRLIYLTWLVKSIKICSFLTSTFNFSLIGPSVCTRSLLVQKWARALCDSYGKLDIAKTPCPSKTRVHAMDTRDVAPLHCHARSSQVVSSRKQYKYSMIWIVLSNSQPSITWKPTSSEYMPQRQWITLGTISVLVLFANNPTFWRVTTITNKSTSGSQASFLQCKLHAAHTLIFLITTIVHSSIICTQLLKFFKCWPCTKSSHHVLTER